MVTAPVKLSTPRIEIKTRATNSVALTLSWAIASELMLADLKQVILSAKFPVPQPTARVNASNRGCCYLASAL